MTDREDYAQPWPPQQGYGRRYPQDQPWQPPQGASGSRQPGYAQPHQPQYPPGPPQSPHRKSWPARHKLLSGLIAFASLVVIAAALHSVSSPGTGKPVAATLSARAAEPSSAARAKSSASPNATANAEAACYKRGFTSGDIYVRMLSPGIQWEAQELGGEWVWNATLGKCLTSAQMTIATAPMVAGSCTQVGYVADNRQVAEAPHVLRGSAGDGHELAGESDDVRGVGQLGELRVVSGGGR